MKQIWLDQEPPVGKFTLHSIVLAAMVVTFTSTPLKVSGYQLYLDGEDSAFRVQSGGWELDKTGSYQGNYRFSVTGPGTGTSVAAWDIDAIPDGTYNLEFYVDNGDYSTNAQYIVEHDSGTTTLTRSQSFIGAGWHPLGTYTFTGAGRVIQTDAGLAAGKKAIADALRITYQGIPPLPNPADSATPAVSIVVDDLGALNPHNSGTFTYTLFNQAPHITYAVLPFLTYSTAVLQDADTKGIETMLHQPLEYIGGGQCALAQDPTRLFVCMTPTQILNVLNTNLNSQAPYIWGLNNHQGSRFSQHRPGLEVAIRELKDRNFYFLDSRTISDSVSYDIAREMGVLTAERDLFVDGTATWTSQQLVESVGQRALYAPNYNHVMICHQRPETVPDLLTALNTLAGWGVEVRRLDHNLHYIVETDHIPEGASVEVNGNWTSTTQDMISHECFDGEALEASNSSNPAASVVFRPNLPKEGMYQVFVATGGSSDATTANVSINHANGVSEKSVSHSTNRNRWVYLASYPFNAGSSGTVTIETDSSSSGTATADAVKFVYDGEIDTSSVNRWMEYQ